MSWFTISGARMDATILAANALLMQLFVIFSYISDGIAFSAEALSGRYIGAGNLGAFRKMINVVGAMCAVAAAMFALAYAAGGAGFLSLLTDDGATVATAVKYLPFAVAIPLVSVAAFCSTACLSELRLRGICCFRQYFRRRCSSACFLR